MNSYTFPENVPISPEAKSLVSKILHLNPTFRPSLDEILGHEFFHKGNTIPKLLPTSTLACAPSDSMLKQFSSKNIDNIGKPQMQTTRQTENENDTMNKAKFDINSKMKADTERLMTGGTEHLKSENKIDNKEDKEKGMRTLAMSIYNPNLLDFNGGEAVSKGPDVWVRKWVDYSSKYGLGYLLSNGSTGVFFNDSTKIVHKTESEVFE